MGALSLWREMYTSTRPTSGFGAEAGSETSKPPNGAEHDTEAVVAKKSSLVSFIAKFVLVRVAASILSIESAVCVCVRFSPSSPSFLIRERGIGRNFMIHAT